MPRALFWAGPLAGLSFFSLTLLFASITPGYDPLADFVSELGAFGAPHAVLANWLMITPFGLLILLTAVWRWQRRSFLNQLACFSLALAGLGLMVAGQQPCDAGCRFVDMSPTAMNHNLAAFGAFIAGFLAVLIFAVEAILARHWRAAFLHGLACLIMGLGFFAMGQAGVEHPYIGGLQRVYLYTLCAWLIGQAYLAEPLNRVNETDA